MPFADLGGVELCYTDEGSGPTVVLHHGTGCDSHDWDRVIAGLLPDFRVIAYDARGHGRSSVPEDFSPQAFAGDFLALTRHLECGPVYAAGHSLGGGVVSTVAVEAPDAVLGVIAIDPGYGHSGEVEEAFRSVEHRFRDPSQVASAFLELTENVGFGPNTSPEVRVRTRRNFLSTRPESLTGSHVGAHEAASGLHSRPSASAYLQARRCPVLAFHTSEEKAAWDETTFVDPRSEAYAFLDSGHWLHLEHGGEISERMVTWLQGLEVSRAS